MARKEEEAPSYIDYGEAAGTSEWTGKELREYFIKQLKFWHKMSILIVSVKEASQAKRAASEYSQDQLERMVDHWLKWNKTDSVHKFSYFFANRHELAKKLPPEAGDYGWDN